MTPLQVTVGDSRGINLPSLIRCLLKNYETPEGRQVDVVVGQGPFIDGLPAGALVLFDRKTGGRHE